MSMHSKVELEFRNVTFKGEEKTGVPREKPRGAGQRTNNKLNPHMTPGPGIELGGERLTAAPSKLPSNVIIADV